MLSISLSLSLSLSRTHTHTHTFSVAEWHNIGPLTLFPEGTTHNQRALIHFKTGAFRSG